ncbi:MAG: gamma-glutamyltransferase [Candidatus Thorarchaeota archaeon]
MFWRRKTGRSDVVAKDGMVSSSQPLATQAGIEILKNGGNAVDAAIAAAAVLDIVEPFSTGCGGDAFALIHLPGNTYPLSFNGSGKSGSLKTLDDLLADGLTEMPLRTGASVTVPGAMHLWCTIVQKHGLLEMKDILGPAINYAKNGFPVSPIISEVWGLLENVPANDEAKSIFLSNGVAPVVGQIMNNPKLADVFENVAENGIDAFYKGKIAEAIAATVQEHGGYLTTDDLATHETEETKAISTSYHGTDVFEHPPNGQGFAALMMLNIMEQFNLAELSPLSSERYHLMIEAKKLAYDDLYRHNADPEYYDVPLAQLLAKDYALSRSQIIERSSVLDISKLSMNQGPDTIYLATADKDGCAVSFINSLYMGFGSGLVAQGTGIKLQNRGNLFSLDPEHPNCYEPGKRPFHTIIPGALYQEGDLMGVFGIMGGAHQSQAHAQFVSNVVDFGMGPQESLDYPRFHHDQKEGTVALENGIPPDVQGELRMIGHRIVHETMSGFGGGQAILKLKGSWIAGSDYRKDGQAAGF